MNTAVIPQYINTKGGRLAVIPADYYEELLQKVKNYEEEDDFFYELSEEDLEKIALGKEQIKVGDFLTNEEVFEMSRNRNLKR